MVIYVSIHTYILQISKVQQFNCKLSHYDLTHFNDVLTHFCECFVCESCVVENCVGETRVGETRVGAPR